MMKQISIRIDDDLYTRLEQSVGGAPENIHYEILLEEGLANFAD